MALPSRWVERHARLAKRGHGIDVTRRFRFFLRASGDFSPGNGTIPIVICQYGAISKFM